MGAYALPIQNNTPDATLNVELWGYKYDDAPGSDDQIVAGSELTRIKSFLPFTKARRVPRDLLLHPNMIYHIGHKLEGDNTEGDYPESLWRDQGDRGSRTLAGSGYSGGISQCAYCSLDVSAGQGWQ